MLRNNYRENENLIFFWRNINAQWETDLLRHFIFLFALQDAYY